MQQNDKFQNFMSEYLDYLEGARNTPPTFDTLSGTQRRRAEDFVETIKATRGIDPNATRPPIILSANLSS